MIEPSYINYKISNWTECFPLDWKTKSKVWFPLLLSRIMFVNVLWEASEKWLAWSFSDTVPYMGKCFIIYTKRYRLTFVYTSSLGQSRYVFVRKKYEYSENRKWTSDYHITSIDHRSSFGHPTRNQYEHHKRLCWPHSVNLHTPRSSKLLKSSNF